MEHEQDDPADAESASGTARLGELATLLEVLSEVDPEGAMRSAISVGGSDSDVLLLAAMSGRFDAVADITNEVADTSPWLRGDLLRAVLPRASAHWVEADVFSGRASRLLAEATGVERYDICYLHKTLHHLRANDCKFRDDPFIAEEACHAGGHQCVGTFVADRVFDALLKLADVVLVSEYHYAGPDDDHVAGSRGGMLDLAELREMLIRATQRYEVRFHRPIELTNAPRLASKNYDRIVGDALRFTDHLVISVRSSRPRQRGRRSSRSSSGRTAR